MVSTTQTSQSWSHDLVSLIVVLGTGPFPVVVYFHGGGWVLGDLDSHDGICRYMCVSTGAVVIAIDYRLSPEAKFPAATEDCYAAVV